MSHLLCLKLISCDGRFIAEEPTQRKLSCCGLEAPSSRQLCPLEEEVVHWEEIKVWPQESWGRRSFLVHAEQGSGAWRPRGAREKNRSDLKPSPLRCQRAKMPQAEFPPFHISSSTSGRCFPGGKRPAASQSSAAGSRGKQRGETRLSPQAAVHSWPSAVGFAQGPSRLELFVGIGVSTR